MIGTPVYDGKIELDFMVSMFKTMELCILNDIEMTLKTIVGCSLIQKARDELFRMAYEAEVDDLIFIDSDQGWEQKDFGNLISPTVDVIGGAVVSKSDLSHYNVKTFDKKVFHRRFRTSQQQEKDAWTQAMKDKIKAVIGDNVVMSKMTDALWTQLNVPRVMGRELSSE
jgi:hypothetical protein